MLTDIVHKRPVKLATTFSLTVDPTTCTTKEKPKNRKYKTVNSFCSTILSKAAEHCRFQSNIIYI